MKSKTLLIIAAVLSLCITLLHIIGGQVSLVDPMLITDMDAQQKVEWLGAWHMITVLLIWMTYQLFQQSKKTIHNLELIKSISGLCFLIALAFVGASIWMQQLAPQWILFLPLALLVYFAHSKLQKNQSNENFNN